MVAPAGSTLVPVGAHAPARNRRLNRQLLVAAELCPKSPSRRRDGRRVRRVRVERIGIDRDRIRSIRNAVESLHRGRCRRNGHLVGDRAGVERIAEPDCGVAIGETAAAVGAGAGVGMIASAS